MAASEMPADDNVSLLEDDEWSTEDDELSTEDDELSTEAQVPSTERHLSLFMSAMVPTKVTDDPRHFMPTDNHRFVEIWVDEAHSEYTFSEGGLQENDVAGWVEENPGTLDRVAAANRKTYAPAHLQPATSHRAVRLLILSPRETQNAGLMPLPVSSQTFKKIEGTWKLPLDFYESMLRPIPVATHWPRSQKCPNTRGVTIRTNATMRWQFCLTIRHDVKTRLTTVVLHGPLREDMDELLFHLKTLTAHALNPWLIPAAVIWPAIVGCEIDLVYDATNIGRQAREVGMDFVAAFSPRRDTDVWREAKAKLDFEHITRQLTSTIIGLSATGTCLKSMRQALNSLEEAFGSAPEVLVVPKKSSEVCPLQHSLEDRMAYLSSFLEGLQDERSRWMEQAHAQMQNVYSLIGQRDNRLNFEMAESSRRVAEASQRDSAAMKAIAEDSKRVALATQKDSAAMRVIAAVSVIFLPGTFTATLFSASFFNFPTNNDRVVSPWIWLYSAVTLTLTVGVLGVWWFRSKQLEKDIDRQYGEGKEKTA